jgi:hypothetical protein
MLRVAQVVDGDDIELQGPLGQDSENQPTDPSKSIDSNT